MSTITHIDWTTGELPTDSARVRHTNYRLPQDGLAEGFIDFYDGGRHPEAGEPFDLGVFVGLPPGIRCVVLRVDVGSFGFDRVYFTGAAKP